MAPSKWAGKIVISYSAVAIDPKHLPDDPKTLQQMVLDLMAQLDREFTGRGKVETLLRELLDAKRNRKSEQLSNEQLALFAALWQARQTERKRRTLPAQKMTMLTKPDVPAPVRQLLGTRPAAARPCRGISSASASCAI